LYVCVIHGEAHLDLKKVAKACKEKNIDLLPLSELEKETGYIRGGCSPVGMGKTV
jgi:ybaK/ebsC protein